MFITCLHLVLFKQALHFTSLACEQGEPEGCWRNAQILQEEQRFPEVRCQKWLESISRLPLFLKSMYSPVQNGCNSYPTIVHFQALQAHKKYCDMSHYFSHHSCYDAGLILRTPEVISKSPQDFTKAFQYFTKGCLLGNYRACYEVSSAYYFGRGVDKNEGLAKEFKKKAEDIESIESPGK